MSVVSLASQEIRGTNPGSAAENPLLEGRAQNAVPTQIPTDSRNANNMRRIIAYVLAYYFWQGKLPESLQPIMGRLLLYMQNGQMDTDVLKGIKALFLINSGKLGTYTKGATGTWTDSNFYWALLQAAKAKGLAVQVLSSDPVPTSATYLDFAKKVMPPTSWQGYDKTLTLNSLNHDVKIAIGYIPASTPAPTPAQAAAQAAQVPVNVAVPPPPRTNNPVTNAVNQALYGVQTTAYETTGTKLSPGQSGLLLAAAAVVIGVIIFFVGIALRNRN